jgi:hypothetical protein
VRLNKIIEGLGPRKPNHALASDPPPKKPGGLRGKFVGAAESTEAARDNFTADDINAIARMPLEKAKARAIELVTNDGPRAMKPEKQAWFRRVIGQARTTSQVAKIMYDLLLSGEGHGVVGTASGMGPSSYRRNFGEGWQTLPPMPDRYQARDGLEGPFMTVSGKVLYYDPKAGKYYDPDTDIYLSYDEYQQYNTGAFRETLSYSNEVVLGPVGQAIEHRIHYRYPDVFDTYSEEEVRSAILDQEDFVGDVEEIGSSDISIWAKAVLDQLGYIDGSQQLNELNDDPRADKSFRYMETYLAYDIFARSMGAQFLAVAYNPLTKSRFAAAQGVDRRAATEALKAEIDQKSANMARVSNNATIDFNVAFSNEFLADPTDPFWVKLGPGPTLVLPSAHYEGDEFMLRADGFKMAHVRSKPGEGTPIHATGLGAAEARTLDLVDNGRYVVDTRASSDQDGNQVYDLHLHSVVADSADRVMLRMPAITIASRRK